MSKVLVVFGATGQQGGSVVDCVLSDSTLSKEFRIRAITRHPDSPAGEALREKGVEVVKCDIDDKVSVAHALKGAHTVFAMTTSVPEKGAKKQELAQGKLLADACVIEGAEYVVWSTIPHVERTTNGKLKNVEHFDGKAEVEDYIRQLPIKSAFVAPGTFMQNLLQLWLPRPAEDGTFVMANIFHPSDKVPMIDVADDMGKFVVPILLKPEAYEGKFFAAADRFYSFEEITQSITAVSGKTVKYMQVPDEVFKGFLPPQMATQVVEMFQFFRDFGYYGPDQEKRVAWTNEQAHGKLTTLQEFLKQNPIPL